MGIVTPERLSLLQENGLDFYGVNRVISDDFCFEPPCSVKFMTVEQECSLGAFSYAVSGFLCGVDIGRYCSFGEDVQIGRQNHPMGWLSTSPFLYLNNKDIVNVDTSFDDNILTHQPVYPVAPTQLKKTTIQNDVWVGHGAIINAGVTIENGAIIAAGSVVTKDVSAYAIVGGSPAKLIRYRFPAETIIQLQNGKWWQYSPEQLKELSVFDINLSIKELEGLANNVEPYVAERIHVKQLFESTL